MTRLGMVCVGGVVALALLQLVRPGIPSRTATAELQAPPEVQHIFQKNCYSCHSDERRLVWFDEIVPVYWLVRHDVLTARSHLNFSTLGSRPAAVQKATVYEAVNMIRLGAMPLPSYRKLHPEANVTAEELATLKAYLGPWAPAPIQSATSAVNGGGKTDAAPAAVPLGVSAPGSLAMVSAEPNGIALDPTFENWKLIGTTDRGDNSTFRFILGNEVAIRAAQSGNIEPWPDGASFAKIAWQQEPGSDGLVHPGKFLQVEFMAKDASTYKDTEGWGWSRWRGLNLQPYGKDAHFVNECASCHLPVHGNDYVYTLPISAAKSSRAEVINDAAAALPASLPYQPLGWSAITMFVDSDTHTTATLYGNDKAMQAVHPRIHVAPGAKGPSYTEGAVLALVTWVQRDDPHWFGARIPGAPQAVEFVRIGGAGQFPGYERHNAPAFGEQRSEPTLAARRTRLIVNLPPARLP